MYMTMKPALCQDEAGIPYEGWIAHGRIAPYMPIGRGETALDAMQDWYIQLWDRGVRNDEVTGLLDRWFAGQDWYEDWIQGAGT